MSDSKSQSHSDSVEVAQEAQQPQHSRVVSNSQSNGKGLAITSLLVALIALGASAYTWYSHWLSSQQSNNDQLIKLTEIQGSVTRLGDNVSRLQVAQGNSVSRADLEAKLSAAENKTDLRLRDVDDAQARVSESLERISTKVDQGANAYAIAESVQLMKLAQYSLTFSGDIRAASRALQLADQQLKTLSDSRLVAVRQQLNAEISGLDSIEQVDLAALTGRLRSLAAKIPSLELENETPASGPVEITRVDEQTWLSGLRNMGLDILALLKPQRIEQAPKPLLAPEQRYFLEQNIQLQIAKAELSAMQGLSEAYQASLGSAADLLSSYYAQRDPAVSSVLEELRALKQIDLHSELPDISRSYAMLLNLRGAN